MNIANLITLARLLSVPVFVLLVLRGELTAAFWLFMAAALSDAADGYIAKKFDMETKLGAYMDPIADKTLLVTTFIVLGAIDILPAWIVIPVVSRDALIVGGALLFEKVTGELDVRPLTISKLNTGCQSALVLAALSNSVFALPTDVIVTLLSFAALVTTLISGGAYVYIWAMRAHVFERESGAMTKGNNREP